MINKFEYIDTNGVKLFTAICLPDDCNKFPTVIFRSPYVDFTEEMDETTIVEQIANETKSFLENGYAIVFQHCRGRGKSDGDCVPYINEREDGLFLQQWVREQPFYNGEIYLCGHSYTSSVHYVTAPFASDVKGAVLGCQDQERYNCNYRNGFYKIASWYCDMYKAKSMKTKNYSVDSWNMLPLSHFSKEVFGESVEDFDAILHHPDKNDEFWNSRFGGNDARGAINGSNIPILLTTGFYDFYIGGVFDMWNNLDEPTKSKSALIVYPYDHSCHPETQPIQFEGASLEDAFGDYQVRWLNAIRNNEKPFVTQGKITYYKLFGNTWCVDDFITPSKELTFTLGEDERTYIYNPNDLPSFNGGLSTCFGGNAWQNEPNLRDDIISVFTPEFSKDTFIKGKMKVKLCVKSDCEDTCFYVRLSLVKNEGYYGLRDDINQISNYKPNYRPNDEIELDFSFDEHAFVVKKGEKIRIDIASANKNYYVRHTNTKGLFCEQTKTKIAKNTVILNKSTLTVFYK